MGLPERPAMRVKGFGVWRDSSGRGFVDARTGRRDVKRSEESIVNGSSFEDDCLGIDTRSVS